LPIGKKRQFRTKADGDRTHGVCEETEGKGRVHDDREAYVGVQGNVHGDPDIREG
jgi:hypothetical protein